MKVKRIYENYTIESATKILKEYEDFTKSIRPFVIEEYTALAKDKHYYPDYGDKPYLIPEDDLIITRCGKDQNEFVFTLEVFNDNNGELISTFYISFSFDDMEQAFLDMTAKNYNL